jgi:hypothetical protein
MTTTTTYFIAALSSARRPSAKRRRHHIHNRETVSGRQRPVMTALVKTQGERDGKWIREGRNRVQISCSKAKDDSTARTSTGWRQYARVAR